MYQHSQQNQQPVFTDFDHNSRVTLPSDKIYVPQNIIFIDSRQRDIKRYPNPSDYRIEFGDIYKNIHNTNKYIDFNIGSTITGLVLKNPGSGYTSNPTVKIDPPLGPNPVQATATATINPSTGAVTSITITNPGSGYYASEPPLITISPPSRGSTAIAEPVIGTTYTAILRTGQYIIGGNPIAPALIGTGLISEIQDSMNYAVNGGNYVAGSISPFQVRLVSQYPTINAVSGTPEAALTNSCEFNRIQITNINSDPWEILFASGVHKLMNAVNVMGYINQNYYNPTPTSQVSIGMDVITDAGTSFRGSFDYDLQDDPKYVLLTLKSGSEPYNRMQSNNGSTNRTFASLIFDANMANVLTNTTGTSSGGYLDGPATKGPFWLPSGVLKPLRGFDYDQKKLELGVADGKLFELHIKFTQFVPNNSPQGTDILYDFAGKEHQLIFAIKRSDNASGQKW
jgi:hypothetical protein